MAAPKRVTIGGQVIDFPTRHQPEPNRGHKATVTPEEEAVVAEEATTVDGPPEGAHDASTPGDSVVGETPKVDPEAQVTGPDLRNEGPGPATVASWATDDPAEGTDNLGTPDDAVVGEKPTTELESFIQDAEIVDDQAPGTDVDVPDQRRTLTVPAGARAVATRACQAAKRPDRMAWAALKFELVDGTVGTAHGAGALWRWMTAAELNQHLATNPNLVLATRKTRRNITLASGGVLLGSGVAAWMLLTPFVPLLAILSVLTVAGVVERRQSALGAAEAGHKALGPSPSGKEVRKVFVSAKLAKKQDEIRLVGPVTRSGDAWEAVAELPPGTTFKSAVKRRGELAGAIGVDEVQLALDPVRGHNGRVRLWCADEDPMQGGPVVSPLVTRTKPVDFWSDKVFAGRDPRGRPVEFSLVERSYLVGGEPGGGKSVACNNVLGFMALDPNVRLWLADGKGGFDLADFEPVAHKVLPEPDHDEIMEMIGELQGEMRRRYSKLRKIGERKVTKKIAEKFDMPPILFHCDEVQKFSLGDGDTKKGKAFVTGIADLVGRGRAAGIITGVVTQRPAADVVPSRLRDILSIRWALRSTTSDASDTILGAGNASRGFSASVFTAQQRGAGFLLAEGADPVQERTAFMNDAEVAGIARRAYEIRKEAGTLPAAGDRPDVRLLSALLDVMEHHKGGHTTDLLPRLARHSDEYAGWDAAKLAAALKPLGVHSKQLDLDGANRNGYRRQHVQDALDRA
ncbi:FtsK/SpoIIIE domain-containing protein [Nocardiopsis nanhaiensis]